MPLYDLPMWMYEVRLLRELGQTGNEMAKYFLVYVAPLPNLGLIAPLWLFHQVFSLEVAAKIYLSVCVAAFPWSFWYGVQSISGRDTPLSYLGFPYLLNLFVFVGQAYLLGLITFFLCVGYFVPRLESLTRTGWVMLFLSSLLLYFVHAIAWFLFLLVLFGVLLSPSKSRKALAWSLLVVAVPTVGLFLWYLLGAVRNAEISTDWSIYSIARNLIKPMCIAVKSYGVSSRLPVTLINVSWLILLTILFMRQLNSAGLRLVRRSPFVLPCAICLFLAASLGDTLFRVMQPGTRFMLPACFLASLIVGAIPMKSKWYPIFFLTSALVCMYNWTYFGKVDALGKELLSDIESTTKASAPLYVVALDWPAGTGLMDVGSPSANALPLIPYYRLMNDGGVGWIHGTGLVRLRPEWISYQPQIKGATRTEFVQSLKDHLGEMAFFTNIVVLGDNDESLQATNLLQQQGFESVLTRPLWTILVRDAKQDQKHLE